MMLKDLKKLAEIIVTLDIPEEQAMIDLVESMVEDHIRKGESIKLVKEAFAKLRVDVKYLAFDLEATRRERDALKP